MIIRTPNQTIDRVENGTIEVYPGDHLSVGWTTSNGRWHQITIVANNRGEVTVTDQVTRTPHTF